jgi:hypothetical protein
MGYVLCVLMALGWDARGLKRIDCDGCRQITAGTVPGHTHAHVVAAELGDAFESIAHGG